LFIGVSIAIVLAIVLVDIVLNYRSKLLEEEIAKTTVFYNQFSDNDYLDFAAKIEASIYESKPAFLNDAIDFSYIEISAKKKGFKNPKVIRNLKRSIESNYKPGTNEINLIKDGGLFSFLKYYKKEGVPHLVFRTYFNFSVKYVDYQLGIKGDDIVIEDGYLYLVGENFSDYFFELAKLQLGIGEEGFSRKYFLAGAKKYEEIQQLLESENYVDAMSLFNTIPPKLQLLDFFQVIKIRISNGLGPKSYEAVVDRFIEEHDDNERVALFYNVFKFSNNMDVERTKNAISKLQENIGKDPVLDIFLGNVYLENDNLIKSEICFNNLVDYAPSLFDGHLFLTIIYIEQKKYSKALTKMGWIYQNFALTEGDLNEIFSKYKEFSNIEEYRHFF